MSLKRNVKSSRTPGSGTLKGDEEEDANPMEIDMEALEKQIEIQIEHEAIVKEIRERKLKERE